MTERPIIAIIGRPNVGKSTLFNRLLKQRKAIVSPVSGTTRDRLYAPVEIGDLTVDLVDTAGLSGDLESDEFGHEMLEQVQLAVQEADLLIFVLDGQAGMTRDDQVLAEVIRKANTPTIVFINKVDSIDQQLDSQLLATGLGPTLPGSLAQRRGAHELLATLETQLKEQGFQANQDVELAKPTANLPRLALIGRPNVGKSTLFNALAGDERVIVSDVPGTTRDAIDSEVQLSTGERFIITDTAGLRRRGKVGRAEKVEQYSVLRTLRAIDTADIVLLVVDAEEGLTRGDAHAAMHATEQKKRLITVVNKVDLTSRENFNWRRFPFIARQPMVFVSAINRDSIEPLLEQIRECLHTLDVAPDQSS